MPAGGNVIHSYDGGAPGVGAPRGPSSNYRGAAMRRTARPAPSSARPSHSKAPPPPPPGGLAAAGATSTVTVFEVLPPVPVQLSVNEAVVVSGGDFSVPLTARLPLQ